MYFKKETYTNDMEILVTPANLVTFSGTILSAGITANSEGKKIVVAGSLIDVDGNVVKQTGASWFRNVNCYSSRHVLYQTVDVTNGDMPGSH
jgi:hypothetical protein